MYSRVCIAVLVVLAGVLLLFGCSSTKPSAETDTDATATEATVDESVSAQTESADLDAAAAAAAAETTVADDAAGGPSTAVPADGEAVASQPDTEISSVEDAFLEATDALSTLSSYSYTTSFTFVGEEDGEVHSGSIELAATIVGDDRMHLEWRDIEEDEYVELIRIGEEAWIYDESGWQSVPVFAADAMSQAVLVFAPSAVWSGLFGSIDTSVDYVGSDTINGIPSKHYTSTYQNWGTYWGGDLTQSAGDVWIADAGYPVKYYFTATGTDTDGSSGTITWSMEIYDVNQTLEITPPELPATY